MTLYKITRRWAEGEYAQYFTTKATALYAYRVVSEDPETIYAAYQQINIVSSYIEEERLYFR